MEQSIPPIILKHHIFERLEVMSRDWQKVCSLRRRLEDGISAEGLIERLVENEVCTRRLGDLLLERWVAGPRFGPIRERCLEVARAIGEHGPYLSAWWILGVTGDTQIRHLVLDDQVLLLLLTPHQPLDTVVAKVVAGDDPTGRALAAAYQGAITQVLTGLPPR